MYEGSLKISNLKHQTKGWVAVGKKVQTFRSYENFSKHLPCFALFNIFLLYWFISSLRTETTSSLYLYYQYLVPYLAKKRLFMLYIRNIIKTSEPDFKHIQQILILKIPN